MKKVIKCTLNSADSCADDELYFTVNDMIYLLNSIAQLQDYEIYATELITAFCFQSAITSMNLKPEIF